MLFADRSTLSLDHKMKTVRGLLAVLLCLAASTGLAAPKPFANADELGEWVTYYYTRPDPSRVAEAIAAASRLGILKDGAAAPPFFGFLAGALGKDPAIAGGAVKRLSKLPKVDQPVLVLGIWYSGLPDTTQLLSDMSKAMPAQRTMIKNLSGGAAPRLTDISLEEGPWVLDALWGNFMATGDEAPVVRIMVALPWVEVRGDIPKAMVGGSAKWSLTSNAVQHPRVLAICKAQLAIQTREVASVLAEVIAQAEKDLATGDASGSNSSFERSEGDRGPPTNGARPGN